MGRADEALERLRNVWRLSPFDPLNFYFWIVAGIAEFVAGRYDEAIAWLRKSKRANPRFIACLRMLAASLALAGDEAGARGRARSCWPSIRPSGCRSFVAWYPLQRAEDLEATCGQACGRRVFRSSISRAKVDVRNVHSVASIRSK